jgi:PAS domain S-box-containing protein
MTATGETGRWSWASLLTLAAIVGVAYSAYRFEVGAEDSVRLAHQRAAVAMGRQFLETQLDAVAEQLLTIARLDSTRDAVATGSAASRERLARDFVAFASHHEVFDQLRLLSADGRERVQVNLGPGGPYVARVEDLRDESARPYVRGALVRAPGEVYVSALDLNDEDGVIERPFKPVVRFATPVVGPSGRKEGLLAVSYLVQPLLDRLARVSTPGRLVLLNDQGDFLVGPERDSEWGDQLPERRGRGFARSHAPAWQVVASEEKGDLEHGEDRLAFETILLPVREGGVGPKLKLVSVAPRTSSSSSPRRLAYALVTLSLLGLVALGDRALARAARARGAAQREARDQLRLFEVITDNVPAPLFYRDAEGRFLACNAAMADLVGWPRGSLAGRRLVEVLDPGVAAREGEADRLVLDTDAPYRHEATFVDGAGMRRAMLVMRAPVRDESGRPTGVTGVALDVTDLRQAQADAERARALLLDAMESLDAGFVIYGPDERLVACNQAYRALYPECAHLMVPGTPYEDILRAFTDAGGHAHTGLPAEEWRAERLRQHRDPRGTREQELRDRFLRVSDRRTRDGGVVSLRTDISALKRQQDELREARDAAFAAARAKSDFLAVMSHEIRTPLNAVIGMTGLLLETGLDAEQREFAQAARSSGEALLTVINDILDFSKIEADKLELEEIEFDPRALIEESLSLVAEGAQAKGLEIVGLVEAEVPPRLVGDPGRLRQVLLNLLSNAVKFTDHGEVSAAIRLLGREGGRALVALEVRDSGIGIEPEARSRLFEPFAQADESTSRRYGGTGLGLAITGRLVARMRGTLEVESVPRQGSTFTCRLSFPEADAPRGQAEGLPGRIALVVDRSATSRTALVELLRPWGLVAQEAAGPAAAARRLGPESALPDVVFVDVFASGHGEGLSFLRALRAEPRLSALRTVALVGLGADVAREARDAGAHAVLTKPVRASALYDCLSGLFALNVGVTESARGPEASFPGHRILVVEDNPVNQRVASAQLRRLGCEVEVAGNGLEALAALARQSYDLVFMDCQMPEMDGFSATRAIRTREAGRGHTSIVAMTANALRGDREACLAAGMDDYVSKPVPPSELARMLSRWARRAPTQPWTVEEPIGPWASERERAEQEPALDPGAIEGLRELEIASEPGLVREILETFLSNAAEKMAALREGVGAGDHPAVERAAHALKGSCGMVGAHGMAALGRAIEEAAERGEAPPSARLDALAREWDRVRQECRARLAAAPPAVPSGSRLLEGAA